MAVKNDEEKCRSWLNRCQKSLEKATRFQLHYFANVKHSSWFKEMLCSNNVFEQE